MAESKISRNDPCPCGSGKKYKKCCMRHAEEIRMKDVVDGYMEWNAEFEKELNQRTESEIKYDMVILEELRRGRSIKRALNAASKKYPDEALEWNAENISSIRDHYEYLLNHEEIKGRIQQMSN